MSNLDQNGLELFGEVRSILASGPPSREVFSKVIVRIMKAQPLGLTQEVLHQLLPYLEGIFSKWPPEYCNFSGASNVRVHPVSTLAKQLTVEPAVGYGQVDVVDFFCKTPCFEQVKHLIIRESFYQQDLINLASYPRGQSLKSLDISLHSGVARMSNTMLSAPPYLRFESLQRLTLQGGGWLSSHLLSFLRQMTTPALKTLILKGPFPADGFAVLFADLPATIENLTLFDVTGAGSFGYMWAALNAYDTLPHLQTLTLKGGPLGEVSVIALLLQMPLMLRLKELDISQCGLPDRLDVLKPLVPPTLRVIW